MNTRRARFRLGQSRTPLRDVAGVLAVLLWLAVVLGAMWLAIG